jgi:hypothetical protein
MRPEPPLTMLKTHARPQRILNQQNQNIATDLAFVKYVSAIKLQFLIPHVLGSGRIG